VTIELVRSLETKSRPLRMVDLVHASDGQLDRLPVVLRILLENVTRTGGPDADAAREAILGWLPRRTSTAEIPFMPGRILMHDTTCGPALVDIAAMRSTIAEAGGDPARLRPIVPVDVSTDHSVAVDAFARPDALRINMAREMQQNSERYRLMKWAAAALGLRVHPPGTGIMHTLNLERLARVVAVIERDGAAWAVPDTLLGTDSHTPMINGIGVLGWGVGGIEAEGVMLGLPTTLRIPDVIGVRLTGRLRDGVLATDLALAVTERLRQAELADGFVEFFGPGIAHLSPGERCVVANMAPEFGANTGYFPVDQRTLDYLAATGRTKDHIHLVESYARVAGLWFDPAAAPHYTDVVDLDLGRIGVSLAGPRRPQDRIDAGTTREALGLSMYRAHASDTPPRALPRAPVAIAAITSCTNTSDPRLLVAAGLLARKARALGLKPRPWVKTSLAPGSPAAERYLARAGVMADLEALGFGIVGYGCTTCIGNSGALTQDISAAIGRGDTAPVAVLSGNRNFPGRVHPDLDLAFLASPPLVVAFALAGDADRNILEDSVAVSSQGRDVTLADLWPSGAEIDAVLARAADSDDYALAYEQAETNAAWAALDAPSAPLWPWDNRSTYIRRPPFASVADGASRLGTYTASPLLVLGDDITTDHVSPAGQIPLNSDAARYLQAMGETASDLNVYAARRGNWEVMLRGLFTNKAARNFLAPDLAPGTTVHAPSGDRLPLWRAAERYAEDGRSTVIVAGERYGMGSSRDWAAKGVALLGVRAVIAKSFERIHRTNLIGMGILPLRLPSEISVADLAIAPATTIAVDAQAASMTPRGHARLIVSTPGGPRIAIEATAAVETEFEAALLRQGGLLPMVVRQAVT
jgi:aconitate hydratase